MTMFTMTPKEVRAAILDCFEAQLVPFIQSSPGMGKSSIVASIAKEFDLELIDLRLSQCAPEDLMGLPMRVGEGADMRAAFAPFSVFPIAGDTVPAGKNGWLLFLDEFNAAPKTVQAAGYKVVLDRMVGQAKLHDQVYVVAAGNLATDRAITNTLSTAMQSRVAHIEMALSHSDFMDYAVGQQWDPRILAFLEFQPTKLHNFKPDHTDRTFACPRTWDFANRLIKGKAHINKPLLAGVIGEGVAVEFCTYAEIFAQLPSYNAICADPENTTLPREPGPLYATVTMMGDKFTRSSFKDAVTYADRLPPEFQVLYLKSVKRRDAAFRQNPEFVKRSKRLVTFMTDEDQALVA